MLASWLFGNSVSDFNFLFVNTWRRPAITFPVIIPTRYVSGENSTSHLGSYGLLREYGRTCTLNTALRGTVCVSLTVSSDPASTLVQASEQDEGSAFICSKLLVVFHLEPTMRLAVAVQDIVPRLVKSFAIDFIASSSGD